MWKKWLVIGCAVGVTVVVAGAAVLGAVWWWDTRERPWDAESLVVVSVNDAQQYYSADFTSHGFMIEFAVRNATGRDITLSKQTRIMRRHGAGDVLEAASRTEVDNDTFIPAGHTVQARMSVEWSCQSVDGTGKRTERPVEECYSEVVDGLNGFVLFDHTQRFKLEMSVPKLKDYKKQ